MCHVGGVKDGGAQRDDQPPIQYHVVKAALGYIMAHMSEEGDDLDSTSAMDLPTPKELIEIRQRKKVGTRV